MLVAQRFYLRREKMLTFLNELKEADDNARSLYIPAGLSPQQIVDLTKKVDLENAAPQMAGLAAGSQSGAVIFWSQPQKYLIAPPLPVVEERLDHGFFVKPLSSLLSHDFQIGLILIRLGAYAIGLCRGEGLVASKVGTGNIHARHRQGGSSQMRFQRHREKQIESFLIRACSHIEEILRPEAKSIDYIVYGGARTTIVLLRKRCSFLWQFDDRCLPALLDISEPRQPVLETAVGRIWSSMVVEWHDNAISSQTKRPSQ